MGWTGICDYFVYERGLSEIKHDLEKDIGVKIVKFKYGIAYGVLTAECMQTDYYKDKQDMENMIVVILWRRSGRELMYKDMNEDMHPYYYDIPIKWLNKPCIALKDSKGSIEYRNKAREYQNKRNRIQRDMKRLKAGDKIITDGYTIKEFIFEEFIRNSIIAYSVSRGIAYRIKKSHITDIILT